MDFTLEWIKIQRFWFLNFTIYREGEFNQILLLTIKKSVRHSLQSKYWAWLEQKYSFWWMAQPDICMAQPDIWWCTWDYSINLLSKSLDWRLGIYDLDKGLTITKPVHYIIIWSQNRNQFCSSCSEIVHVRFRLVACQTENIRLSDTRL